MKIISPKSFICSLIFTSAMSTLSIACSSSDGDTPATIKEEAVLTVAMEVPAPTGTTAASGIFKYELSETTGLMTYTLTVADLTGPVLMAHIHKAAVGAPGPIVMPLAVPSGSSSVIGDVTLDAATITDLKAGGLYVNVHTAANSTGEIRGQLKGK